MKWEIGEAPGADGLGAAEPVGEVRVGRRGLLSAAEVAGYLRVHQGTVYRWCREGRLPCVKVGKYWRMYEEALEELLAEQKSEQESEHKSREGRPATLDARLESFFKIPDNVFGIAQSRELLHRLDAAFFRVGHERGGTLVMFYGGESGSEEEIRADLEQAGLEVERLQGEGRLRFVAEADAGGGSPGRRMEVLGRLAAQETNSDHSGRSVWAAFDWERRIRPEAALDQQQALTRLVGSRRLVVKTSMLEQLFDDWNSALWRRAQTLHPGTIWLSHNGLALNRVTPLPPH